MRYTNEQISVALMLLKATGSPKQVIDTLGYSSSPMLYHCRDMYPKYYTVPDQKHWKQAPNLFAFGAIPPRTSSTIIS